MVTGGAGFIGSTLVDRLLADGHVVDVLDDLSTGSRDNLAEALDSGGERLTLHEHDVATDATVDLVASCRPDLVFHLAAQADVRVSVSDPVRDAAVNILGSLHVMEGARAAHSTKIVFASSGGTIYGAPDPADLPVGEAYPQRPVSPYGVAKKTVGDYLHAYRELHGVDYTSLALANVFGPRQDPHGEAGAVAIFAGRLLSGAACTVYGDGEQTRDFVYVDDVVDAFVRSVDRAGGLLLNIGSGEETTVNRLYGLMASQAGVDLAPRHEAARAGELVRSALDPSLARRELGWRPETTIEAGVGEVLRWFSAFG